MKKFLLLAFFSCAVGNSPHVYAVPLIVNKRNLSQEDRLRLIYQHDLQQANKEYHDTLKLAKKGIFQATHKQKQVIDHLHQAHDDLQKHYDEAFERYKQAGGTRRKIINRTPIINNTADFEVSKRIDKLYNQHEALKNRLKKKESEALKKNNTIKANDCAVRLAKAKKAYQAKMHEITSQSSFVKSLKRKKSYETEGTDEDAS